MRRLARQSLLLFVVLHLVTMPAHAQLACIKACAAHAGHTHTSPAHAHHMDAHGVQHADKSHDVAAHDLAKKAKPCGCDASHCAGGANCCMALMPGFTLALPAPDMPGAEVPCRLVGTPIPPKLRPPLSSPT
ncbi:MAG: hypothetical protein M3A44_10810 [Gammaproteobacteria bacterium]